MAAGIQSAAAEQAQRAAGAEIPSLASIDELADFGEPLWYGAHSASFLAHVAFAAWLAHTGVILFQYPARPGYGLQFGQAILLASPLFEPGARQALLGRSAAPIPLSALTPPQKFYAPDLRSLASRPRPRPQSAEGETEAGGPRVLEAAPLSALALPFSAGARPQPARPLEERAAAGAATPFELVPPSNATARRSGQKGLLRLVLGDASIAGGGQREGLRLPASPRRVALSVEAAVDRAAAPDMEQFLTALASRLRRAAFDLLPDRRELGPPGVAIVSAAVDRAGRITQRTLASGSGNPDLDRLALALLGQIPDYQPLPRSVAAESVPVRITVRYYQR